MISGVYLDGVQIHSNTVNLGLGIAYPVSGLDMPTVRFASYDKIGEWGSFVSNQLYGGRIITLNGKIWANTPTTHGTLRRQVSNLLQIQKDSNSVPIAHTLLITTMDGLSLTCQVYIQNFVMDITGIYTSEYQATFFCPDFALLNSTVTTVTISAPRGGGVVIPVIIPATLAGISGGSASASNNGDCPSFPTITLNGPLTNPIIQNNTLVDYLELEVTLSSGQSIVIDMKNHTITQGGAPASSDFVSGSNWWWLNPGANTLQLQTGSTSDTGNAVIQYSDAYIGV